MGAQSSKKIVIMAKLQASLGEVVTPVASDALRVDADVEYTPDVERVERNLVSATFSKPGSRAGAASQRLTFRHEACGAGLDGTNKPKPPYYDALLQACGMARTDDLTLLVITPGTGEFAPGEVATAGAATGTVRFACGTLLVLSGVTGTMAPGPVTGGTSTATATITAVRPALEYKPVSLSLAQQKLVTLFRHRDGVLMRLRDGVGSWTLDCPSGQIPKFQFSFTAPWQDPADQPLPSPVLPDIVPPVFLDAQARLGGYAPHFTSLKLDLANKISPRRDANSAAGITQYFISDRAPTGSLDPEADDLATFNPYSLWRTSTPSGLVARIGADAGNSLYVAVPKLRTTSVAERDRDGVGTYDLGFEPSIDTVGDDELRLYFC